MNTKPTPMRILAVLLLPALLLTGCATTPADRCFAYTGAIARYEGIERRGEVLSEAQRAAYDLAIAGQAATCGD